MLLPLHMPHSYSDGSLRRASFLILFLVAPRNARSVMVMAQLGPHSPSSQAPGRGFWAGRAETTGPTIDCFHFQGEPRPELA
ncbi:hypothetical protein B0J15DRAFT_497523 [Fusarium solani]|uniref:Uncharacterized protein n=1 Tax=Fusarium solani TaxID=169388 RepID=A0A9P9H392_FUSSL|nr:uncharacterized protein B0J15DRAFT_497523 [Fusarium solani]KAH7249384.1 hypothetical protein B0J15DRAFT_497523 [Fusarium solani]